MVRGHLICNSRLLKNLNTYINEDHLLIKITQLSAAVNKIESNSGRSRHTIKMGNEIAKLEDQLSYAKHQANLRTQEFHKTESED